MMTKRNFIISIWIAVAIVLIGVIIATVLNQELPSAEQARQSLIWTFVIGFIGIILNVVVAVYFKVTEEKPRVEVIEDQGLLKDRYEQMRRTKGAYSIQAIWSAKYPDVDTYFRTESQDLLANSDLEIERLVNPTVIGGRHQESFAEFVGEQPNLTIWATDVSEFECFICEYRKSGINHIKAMLVLNDTLGHTPQLGIYIDPEKSAELKPLAYALQSWYLHLPRVAFPGLEKSVDVWEVNAPAYDLSVSTSGHVFLRDFMSNETRMLETLLVDLARDGETVAVVEVGSGTGRTLFNLARDDDLQQHVKCFIGIDSSRAMTKIARGKREILVVSNALREKFFFFRLKGEELSKYFSQGRIRWESLERDHKNGEQVGRLNGKSFEKHKKILCCLLNTLGILEEGARAEIIRNMVAAAGPNDTIVFSVFSSEAFDKEAPALYGTITELVGEFTASSFNSRTSEFRTANYYSMWFNRDSLRAELERHGCSVVDIQALGSGGYFFKCRPAA